MSLACAGVCTAQSPPPADPTSLSKPYGLIQPTWDVGRGGAAAARSFAPALDPFSAGPFFGGLGRVAGSGRQSPLGEGVFTMPFAPAGRAAPLHAGAGASRGAALYGPSAMRIVAGSVSGSSSRVTMLNRHRYLIASTAHTAPLFRASAYGGLTAASPGVANVAAGEPLGGSPAGRGEGDATTSPPTLELSDYLRGVAAGAYARSIAEGWTLFRAGEYRSAAYAFDAGLVLARRDPPTEVGRVFCEVALGRYDTAALGMKRGLASFGESLLDRPVELIRRFPSVEDYLARLGGLRAHVAMHSADVDAAALYAFFLWHAGQSTEALAVADLLKSRAPKSPYAGWSALMRARLQPPALGSAGTPGSAPLND